MESIKQFYDKHVECWQNNPRHGVRQSYLSVLGDVKGKHILDIGCGCGFDIKELSDSGAFGTGLDISEHSLQIAKERLGNECSWNLLCEDFFNYSPEQKFDIVIFSMIVMHYADLNIVFKQLAQFLKPSGQLLLVTNNPYLVLLDYDLPYPPAGKSIEYTHKFVFNSKEILVKKYLHAFSDFYNIAKANDLVVDVFQEIADYSEETRFYNPNPHNGIPNFITFLYIKS